MLAAPLWVPALLAPYRIPVRHRNVCQPVGDRRLPAAGDWPEGILDPVGAPRRPRRAVHHSQAAAPTAAEMPDDLTKAPAADYYIPRADVAVAAAAAGSAPILTPGCAVGPRC